MYFSSLQPEWPKKKSRFFEAASEKAEQFLRSSLPSPPRPAKSLVLSYQPWVAARTGARRRQGGGDPRRSSVLRGRRHRRRRCHFAHLWLRRLPVLASVVISLSKNDFVRTNAHLKRWVDRASSLWLAWIVSHIFRCASSESCSLASEGPEKQEPSRSILR